jgi:ketosteroid isomerase-like protein
LSEALAVFGSFVAAVNARDAGALASLLAEYFLFIDTLANRVEGAASMEGGWRAYFEMCPDYRLRIDEVVVDGALALATGEAGGTIDGVAWRTPAAWKAIVRDG